MIEVTANGNIELDEQARQQAEALLGSLEVVNLDEVTTDTIRVALRDFRLVPETDEEGNVVIEQGQQKMRRKFYTRVAEVENFVPMYVFNRMMATRKRTMALRQKYIDNPQDEENFDPMMTWMTEQVLAVWRVTEPDMTLERLNNGLTFEKISRLFTLFFGHLLQMSGR